MKILTLALVVFLSGVTAQALEQELYGVKLGSDYAETLAKLTKKYGRPFQSQKNPEASYDAFLINKQTQNILLISTRKNYSKFVAAVQLSGTTPIQGFNYVGALNLGLDKKVIEFGFPKPSSIDPVEDGYTQYNFAGTNLSVQVKDGKIASIRIGNEPPSVGVESLKGKKLSVLSENHMKAMVEELDAKKKSGSEASDSEKEALLTRLTTDRLREHCDYSHLIRYQNGVYTVDAIIGGYGGAGDVKDKVQSGTFLLDTGMAVTAITPAFCKKIKCEIKEPATKDKPGKTSGGTVLFGVRGINLPDFDLENSEVFDQFKVDGVIGRDVLLSQEVFLSLRDEYMCFPKGGVSKVAQKLGFKSVPAKFDDAIQVPFTFNKQQVEGLFLDTGSDGTSILKKDIAALKLKNIPGERKAMTVLGSYSAKSFGPVAVAWANASSDFFAHLSQVSEAQSDQFHKVGNDVLHGLIIGLDKKGKRIFLNK